MRRIHLHMKSKKKSLLIYRGAQKNKNQKEKELLRLISAAPTVFHSPKRTIDRYDENPDLETF